MVGDETPLTELLKTRQQADFVPVVNEVLDMKRRMKKEGAGTDQIEQAVRERLGGEGVELKSKHHKRLLFLFLGFGWLLTLLRYPGAWFRKAGNASVEKAAQATAGQLAAVALAAVIGSGIAIPLVERGIPRDIAELQQEIGSLQDKNRELERSNGRSTASVTRSTTWRLTENHGPCPASHRRTSRHARTELRRPGILSTRA